MSNVSNACHSAISFWQLRMEEENERNCSVYNADDEGYGSVWAEEVYKQIQKGYDKICMRTKNVHIHELSSLAMHLSAWVKGQYVYHINQEHVIPGMLCKEVARLAMQANQIAWLATTQDIPNLVAISQLVSEVNLLMEREENFRQPKIIQVLTGTVKLSRIIMKSLKASIDCERSVYAMQLVTDVSELLKSVESWLAEGRFQDAELESLMAANESDWILERELELFGGLDSRDTQKLDLMAKKEFELMNDIELAPPPLTEEEVAVRSRRKFERTQLIIKREALIFTRYIEGQCGIERRRDERKYLINRKKIDLIVKEMELELNRLIKTISDAVDALK